MIMDYIIVNFLEQFDKMLLGYTGWKNKVHLSISRGVLRTPTNILDGELCDNKLLIIVTKLYILDVCMVRDYTFDKPLI